MIGSAVVGHSAAAAAEAVSKKREEERESRQPPIVVRLLDAMQSGNSSRVAVQLTK